MCESKTSRTPNYNDETNLAEHMAWADGQLMEMSLINNSYKHQFGEVQAELHNDFLKNVNSHPPKFDEAFSLLLNHKKTKKPLLCKGEVPKGDEIDKNCISLAQREDIPHLE